MITLTNWLRNFVLSDPLRLSDWSARRVHAYEKQQLEALGIGGFGYGWHRAHLERIREAEPVTRVTSLRKVSG